MENLGNYKKLRYLYEQAWNNYKCSKVNMGQLQAAHNRERKHISCLADVEFQVFSQFGDDGIIQWLVHRIPFPNKTFIEFGVENYREANTRFLLINNYWSGMVIDGDKENIRSLQQEQLSTFYDLQSECSFIKKSNINGILNSAKFNKEVGILSVDIDGNDYWIWKAIDSIDPVVVISEYNCLFGFDKPLTISYKDDFIRGKERPFNFYGTSLLSAYNLAKEKGYEFIGCNSAGNNAYFVKQDYLKYLALPVLTVEQGYVFAGFTEAWDNQGIPIRGADKVRSIDKQLAVSTDSGNEELVDAEEIIRTLILANKLNRF
ncbi:MAG: hypothetical protein ACKVOQ_20730 [Cyclobacteriaceae bacterium]